jgi:hypothetical protein
MATDDELDDLIAGARPTAPADFVARVEARVRVAERAHKRRVAAVGTMLTLAAAAVLLLLARPRPPTAPRVADVHSLIGEPANGSWRVVAARAATVSAAPGNSAAGNSAAGNSAAGNSAAGNSAAGNSPAGSSAAGNSTVLAVGGVLRPADAIVVGDGGEARLARGGATLTLAAAARAHVAGDGELVLDAGEAQLGGDGARAQSGMTTVTALGGDAEISVQSNRRNEMNPIKPSTLSKPILAAAAAATLVAVVVHRGQARVAANGRPTVLAAGERALVEDPLASLVTRAPRAAADGKAADDPLQGLAIDDGSSGAPLERAAIMKAMSAQLTGLRRCYEQNSDGKRGGRLVVLLTIASRAGKGVVDEAEIVPESNTLDAPVAEQCMLETLLRAPFPAPKAQPIVISYPLIFQSHPAPAEDDGMQLIQPHF